jgi:hypothetical protein
VPQLKERFAPYGKTFFGFYIGTQDPYPGFVEDNQRFDMELDEAGIPTSSSSIRARTTPRSGESIRTSGSARPSIGSTRPADHHLDRRVVGVVRARSSCPPC